MAKFKINYVIEGQGKDDEVVHGYNDYLVISGNSKRIPIKKSSVSSYQVIDESNKEQYSFWKGALGVALLGGLGATIGLGGKQKKEFLIAIHFKDGNKSLILLDDNYYKYS